MERSISIVLSLLVIASTVVYIVDMKIKADKQVPTPTIFAPSLEECKAAIEISNNTRWNTKEAIFLAMSIKEQCPYGEVYLKGVQE